MTISSATDLSILKSCYDGNMHTYVKTWELKQKPFTVNSENIKQAIAIQVTFILENKLQKEHFLVKNTNFFCELCVNFESPLGWECAY